MPTRKRIRGAKPRGFVAAAAVERVGGEIRLSTRDQPPSIWVIASGYVGPSLLSAELEFAERFARKHADGWTYVADTTKVVVINPLNVVWLRRIRALPGLRRYVVIAPLWMRLLAPLVAAAVGVDEVVADAKAALAAIDR
jgi:hypothetical protein